MFSSAARSSKRTYIVAEMQVSGHSMHQFAPSSCYLSEFTLGAQQTQSEGACQSECEKMKVEWGWCGGIGQADEVKEYFPGRMRPR
jgi:hypothetical protein